MNDFTYCWVTCEFLKSQPVHNFNNCVMYLLIFRLFNVNISDRLKFDEKGHEVFVKNEKPFIDFF